MNLQPLDHDARRRRRGVLGAVVLVVVGAVIGVTIAVRQGWAHGDAEWIMRGLYRDLQSGELCCGPEDCSVVPARDVVETDAGWRILSSGEYIPRGEAQRSRDGDFWRCQRADGSRRCWFYPVPGS